MVRRSTQPLKLSVDSTRRGSGERESFLMVFRSHLFDPSDVGPVLTQSHPCSNHHLLPPSPPPYAIPMSRIHHYPFTYSATTSSNLLLLCRRSPRFSRTRRARWSRWRNRVRKADDKRRAPPLKVFFAPTVTPSSRRGLGDGDVKSCFTPRRLSLDDDVRQRDHDSARSELGQPWSARSTSGVDSA